MLEELNEINWSAMEGEVFNVNVSQCVLDLINDDHDKQKHAYCVLFQTLQNNDLSGEIAYHLLLVLLELAPLTMGKGPEIPSLLDYIIRANYVEEPTPDKQNWSSLISELIDRHVDMFVQWATQETSEERKAEFIKFFFYFASHPDPGHIVTFLLTELENDTRYSVRRILTQVLSSIFKNNAFISDELRLQFVDICRIFAEHARDLLLRLESILVLYSMDKKSFSDPVETFFKAYKKADDEQVFLHNFEELRSIFIYMEIVFDDSQAKLLRSKIARHTTSKRVYSEFINLLLGEFSNFRDDETKATPHLSQEQIDVLKLIISKEAMPLPSSLANYRLPTTREGLCRLLEKY